jgi:hypothetical protein
MNAMYDKYSPFPPTPQSLVRTAQKSEEHMEEFPED